jgi:glycosyltransferase involved in cell wall biosynthesis
MKESGSYTTLVFWQNQPSMHQGCMIRKLSEQFGYNVVVVTESDLSDSRKCLGWNYPDLGDAQLIISPRRSELQRLAVKYSRTRDLHICSGIGVYPMVSLAFSMLIRTPAIRGVYAESPDPRGIKGTLRRIRTRFHAKFYSKYIHFMLAVGELGYRWYTRNGFSDSVVFTFGYWVENVQKKLTERDAYGELTSADYAIVYIGQLVHRKGVDLLLCALASMSNAQWQLSIIGDGPQLPFLKKLVHSLGIEKKVHWLGMVPNSDLHIKLASADLMVLPSRFDGWGAVVNEALLAGVPVICSDACGASILVKASGYGRLFRAQNVGSLKAALVEQLREGKLDRARRNNIRDWASFHISGEAAALYLHNVIQFVLEPHGIPRPLPPWMESKGHLAHGL